MPRTFLLLALAAALLAGGCGDEPTPTPETPPLDEAEAEGEMFTDPSARTAPITPAEQLATVHASVAAGRAMSGARWQDDLEGLADLLWAPDGKHTAADIRTHMQILHIAGDAGRAFARDPEEIDRWREQHPVDLKIHDAFMQAAKAGPKMYRAFIRVAAPALLVEKTERLQERFRK